MVSQLVSFGEGVHKGGYGSSVKVLRVILEPVTLILVDQHTDSLENAAGQGKNEQCPQ